MGVIKIESFDVDATTPSSSTHTLTTDVGSLNSAFLRRTTSIDKQSGPVGNTGNINPNQACGAAYLSATNQISFRQNLTQNQKMIGEVWRYTGAAAGPDEFIVRGRYTVTLNDGSTTGSTSVSGISNRDKCIPFWTGSTHTASSTSDFNSATVSVFIDGSDNIQCQRGASTGTMVVYVTVVEFVGVNWAVGHGRSLSHDSAQETISLNTASTATGGSTFNVGSWLNAMIIEGSLEGDTGELGIADNIGVWFPGNTNQATFSSLSESAARNDGGAYCHVLTHPGIVVNRDNNTNISEGNSSYVTQAFPAASSSTESLDELSMEWFTDTTGTGTAHARGRLSAEIITPSSFRHWVHRSGNNVRADWGIAQVAGISGVIAVIIDDVDGDNVVNNNQLNVVIAASNGGLGSVQGSGKVELVELTGYSGTIVNQVNIDSWSDTSIQVDIISGSLANKIAFLYVTTDSGTVGSIAIQIGLPPETPAEAILSMSVPPSHYWQFQNNYADTTGTATADAQGKSGTSFPTTAICKGDTHSLLINNESHYTSPVNQNDMNGSTEVLRYFGGWLMLDRISQTLSVIWEEGAQVNNIAMLNGFGNNLVIQIADAGEDYVQLYLDISLAPNRPYHIMFNFNGNATNGGVCRAWLDGILQSRTDGNPWEQPELDSHSGNITWGHQPGESLKVGDDRGVDATTIAFVSPVACNYAHWYNWTDVVLDAATEIRQTLVEKFALQQVTIIADTQANMQVALDAQSDTLFPDQPCSIEIEACFAGDFTLTLDNINFVDRVSIQIRYVGADTLTLVSTNGSNVDEDKLAVPYGGTIIVQRPATLTFSGIVDGSTIFIRDNATKNILGSTGASVGNYILSVSVPNIDYLIMNLGYKLVQKINVAVSGDSTIPILQAAEINYLNPI